MKYFVHRTNSKPDLKGNWAGDVWNTADIGKITNFRPETKNHYPRTEFKLRYDDNGIYGIFRVEDKYVRSVNTEFQSLVCRDSCVEFFAQPDPIYGYYNFEFNCGGCRLCHYNYYRKKPASNADERVRVELLKEEGDMVKIYHSMPEIVEPEITDDTDWTLEFFIPFSLFKKYSDASTPVSGTEWRANFFKCGDETSHPHWASWSPVDQLNFHLPHCFGIIVFQ